MDVAIVLVVCGCAVVGLFTGAARIATTVAAVAAAVAAGRLAGPAAAELVTRGAGPGIRTAAIGVTALLAVVLVWLAGLGLRRGLAVLRLTWLDRLAGLLFGGGVAVVALALLLGLAAMGGHRASSPWAARLASAGEAFLAHQRSSVSSASPSSSPSTPTSSGQQPH